MNPTTATKANNLKQQVVVYGAAILSAAAIAYAGEATLFARQSHAADKPAMVISSPEHNGSVTAASSLRYICPMHPEMQSHVHGDDCPICGMKMLADAKCDVDSGATASDFLMKAMPPRPNVRLASAMVNRLGVRSEVVKIGEVRRRVETPGFIQSLSDEGRSRYAIPADGQIDALYVRRAQWVKKGQKLFSWSSPMLAKTQKFHLRLLEQLGAESDSLKSGRERLMALGMSEEDVQELERSGRIISSIQVRARREGRVMQLSAREGESFKKGQMLFNVGGNVRATVLANAFQRDAAWIRPGQQAEIRLQGRGKAYPAVVSQGAVSINPNSQNIGVKLSFSAPIDDVRQAMYVSGVIFDKLHDEVLTVPVESVIWQPGGNRVILDKGKGLFQPVLVSLGEEVDGRVVVHEGLSVGDRVVSSAQFLIDSESNLRMALSRLDSHSTH
ncbi:MAG: efflux RND transporter periplasmic adaptor subunit [Granulosicoccaceae bacterium]